MKDPSRSSSSNMTFSNDIILTNQFNMEDNPFAEYMWMENEEEFNRQVEEELWEEDFIERCFQEMLEEEELLEWFIPSRDLPSSYSSSSYSSSQAVSQLQEQINLLVLGGGGGGGADQEPVVNGNLSPNAEEFTPAVQKHMV